MLLRILTLRIPDLLEKSLDPYRPIPDIAPLVTKKLYNLKMFRDFKAVRQMQAGEYPTFQRYYHGKNIAKNGDFEDLCNTEQELGEISDEESEREPGEISDDQ
jgi:hypothetical protein